jgi:CubicO group peptidase (beta-lactamase class C family)
MDAMTDPRPASRFRFARSTWRTLPLALATLVSLSCASAPSTDAAASRAATSASASVFPGAEWERHASPEGAGWSSAGLDSVRAMLDSMPSTGFMAVVGGRVVFEWGDLDTLSYLASVRKSILSMLYGNYVASGKVDLDRTLEQMGIDDHQGLTAQEKQATARHLITSRSGVYHPASNAGDDLASAPPRGSQEPGTYQLYSNWDFNAIGYIFEHETGRNIFDALETELARPIGFQDWNRAIHRKNGDSTRSRYLAYHMHLSTRDMARIGYLMLREGNWNGRQIVPRAWVRETTRPVTRVWEMNPDRHRRGPFGYGYLWWVWDGEWNRGPYAGGYSGLGAVGQHITVLPALDLVVAHKTAPQRGRRGVSHQQYLALLDQLVRAHCGAECPRP